MKTILKFLGAPGGLINRLHVQVYNSNFGQHFRARPFTTLAFLLTIYSLLFYIAYLAIKDIYELQHKKQYQNQMRLSQFPEIEGWPYPQQPYLINSSTCVLPDWPMFDNETKEQFESHYNETYKCSRDAPPFSVRRVNFSSIQIDFPQRDQSKQNWTCFARDAFLFKDNVILMTEKFGPLKSLTNFEPLNKMGRGIEAFRETMSIKDDDQNADPPIVSKWEAIQVTCQESRTGAKFTQIVPLIQSYEARHSNIPPSSQNSRPNVLLFGVDSISRLNFLRHMIKTKRLIDARGFMPMYGHHKVGENTIPNVHPMLTGRHYTHFCQCSRNDDFTFDDVPLIFGDFRKAGYVTTFIEDLPGYGLFNDGFGGFRRGPPTDYYLRPANLLIWDGIYRSYTCYKDRAEYEIYWDYILDLLDYYKSQNNSSPHFTFSHLSTLTHEYLNHAGYADLMLERFFTRFFSSGHDRNTMIIFYADHAIRFAGDESNTTANFYEQRLPFLYLYIPDEMRLGGKTAYELRCIVRGNSHRLTSHFDLHATMMHVITGREPKSEQFGRSLLAPIPENRTCAEAGIPAPFCLCNPQTPIEITPTLVADISLQVVNYMNERTRLYGNHCVPLVHDYTYRAYVSVDQATGEEMRFVHFHTEPNNGYIEAMVRLANNSSTSSPKVVVQHITRLDAYTRESHCVRRVRNIVQFCLCWDIYEERLQNED